MPVNVTAGNGSNFDIVQVGDIIYGPNYWGTNTSPNVNPNTNGTWSVPCGSMVNSDCYTLPVEGSAEDTNQCTFCYTVDNPQRFIDSNGNLVTEPVSNTFEVQAYPYYLLGSGDGGRDNTWGNPCGVLNQLAPSGRCNSAVYDMRQSRDAVGLPQRLDLINTLKHYFEVIKDCGGQASNVENVFFDTYLHRI